MSHIPDLLRNYRDTLRQAYAVAGPTQSSLYDSLLLQLLNLERALQAKRPVPVVLAALQKSWSAYADARQNEGYGARAEAAYDALYDALQRAAGNRR